jgi:hypothetical protein
MSESQSKSAQASLPAAEQLLEIEAIKRLKARYFRLMDSKDWEGFAAVFASDAEIDVSDDAGPDAGHVSGGSEIAASIQRAVGAARTVHHGHMPEIELTSPTTASGVWAMFDYVEWPAPKGQPGRVGLKGYGHYIETYRKIDGEWRIASMKLARLRIDSLG